jgi:hypothetical protein
MYLKQQPLVTIIFVLAQNQNFVRLKIEPIHVNTLPNRPPNPHVDYHHSKDGVTVMESSA